MLQIKKDFEPATQSLFSCLPVCLLTYVLKLGVNPLDRSRKGNRFADVLDAA